MNNPANNSEKQSPSRQIIHSFEAKLTERRTLTEKIADYFTKNFGSVGFFIFNLGWFSVWVLWNSGAIPALPVFDPYPFVLLITAVSLEAICLAVLVLISQNRAAKIDKLRSELDLQINLLRNRKLPKF